MSRSFYLGNNAELYTGTQTFASLISAAPTSYGLTAPQAAAYQSLSDSYVSAYLLSQAPETRTKGSIVARNDLKILLVQKAAELAKIIQATPTVTNEQRADLGLSVRSIPAPKPAPGTPSNFKVSLRADGSVEARFKSNNPPGVTGVIYQVWRRIGASGPFTYICGTGQRKFIDATIPQGTAQVTYQLQGVRSTAAGEWAQFNVNFGIAPSGESTASVLESKVEPRMAA